MFGLLYRAARYIMKPTALNKGEVDQPPPPSVRVAHLEAELVRAHQDVAKEAARVARILADRYAAANDQSPTYPEKQSP